MRRPIRTVMIVGLFLAGMWLMVGCQESLPERCQREAREYTKKKCPVPINEVVTLDSLTFDSGTLTIHYHYTVKGHADSEEVIERSKEQLASSLLAGLRNSTEMKVYMDAHYRFAYTYHSATHPETVLWEAVYTDKDYQ